MAIYVQGYGTITLSASEQTIAAAVTGTAVAQIDLTNMAAGDVVELRCYVKTLTAGTARLIFDEEFSDAQTGSPVFQSIPIAAPYSVEFKVIQPTGTFRGVDYCVFVID